MSIENKKTVEAYQNGGAEKYLQTIIIHDNLNIEKANKKRDKLNNFIIKSFATLPQNASILEIGSGNGENAKFIQNCGFNVTASDIADAFISTTKKFNINTIRFNLLEDNLRNYYDGIFCWRVFVHFSQDDFIKALSKVYSLLKPNGIFIFNVINRETKNVDSEMVDFPNEYHLGVERYYHYFTKSFIDKEINKSGFEINSFHTEGGEQNNKWLVYTLKK